MMIRRMQRKWRCLWVSIGLTGQNISPIGRFFLTLYKQSCGSLSMLMLDHTTVLFLLKGSRCGMACTVGPRLGQKSPFQCEPEKYPPKINPSSHPWIHLQFSCSPVDLVRAPCAHTSPHDHGVQFIEVGCSDINETGSNEQEPTIKSPPTGR